MSSSEKTARCEMVLTAAPGEPASLDDERDTAQAVLHRDIERVLPNLRRYARSLTRDVVDADDLVQECLARAIDWTQYESSWTCAPDQIEHLEIRDLVRALKALPEEQRTAVLLISLSSDYYEAASACKVPVGTIRSRLSRGRKTLRALMSAAPLEPHIANRCARTAKDSPTPLCELGR